MVTSRRSSLRGGALAALTLAGALPADRAASIHGIVARLASGLAESLAG